MKFIDLSTVILFLSYGCHIVQCQLGSAIDIQSFLNQFCRGESTNEGCSDTSVIRPDVALPRPTTPSPPVTPGIPAPTDSCGRGEKRCPQLRTKCVPNNVDCNVINSGITCPIPEDYGVETQVLICGDDTPNGLRCGLNSRVPVLTVLLVQCQGANQVNQKYVSSLDVLNAPGDDGGAGIYQCLSNGEWTPMLDSPFLNQLRVSCRNAGCGYVPHPTEKMPIFRRWSWVRGLYKNGDLHCTGTLVSPNAILTAAHCVTKSTVSNQVDPNIQTYEIELPGPSDFNPSRKVQADEIHIHPRYSYNNQKYLYDLAIIFFKFRSLQILPTVCVADRPYTAELGRHHVVFDLKGESQSNGFGGSSRPTWEYYEAKWDHSCLSTSIRANTRCQDTLTVQTSQFCAEHAGVSLSPGSSGGPYLAEVGKDQEEIWVVMGVLSNSKRISGSGCSQEHSIYGQVAEDSRWIKDCVFDKRCGSAFK